jgi:hypothetical protein
VALCRLVDECSVGTFEFGRLGLAE